MKKLLLLLCLLPVVSQAEIYRYKDAEGNLTFSDKPREGAEKVRLKPVQVYKPAPVRRAEHGAEQAAKEKPSTYETLQIVAPRDGQTLWSAEGRVSVEVQVIPALAGSDKLAYWVDGKLYQESTSTVLDVTELNRGAHTLQVQVIDVFNHVALESKKQQFQLQKPSRLSPSRAS